MNALLTRKRNLENKLAKIKTRVDKHAEEAVDVYDVDLLTEQLDEVQKDYNALYDAVMIKCNEGDEQIHQNSFGEISDRIYSTKKVLKIIGATYANIGGTSIPHPGPNSHPGGAMHIKLPKQNLPKFSGNYLDWTQFQDLFESSVNSQNIPGAQKLLYLKGCLSGEAADLIEGYQISDASYAEAWTVMKRRYQNDRELVKSQICKFNDQSRMKEKDAGCLRKLVDISTSCVLALKVLGRAATIDEENDWLTFGIMDRLDPETRELWESKLGRNVMPKLSPLLEFLDERVNVLSSSTSTSVTKKKEVNNDKKQLSAHQASTDKECPICQKSSHLVHTCNDFIKLSIDERREAAKEKRLCFKCLKVGHNATQCRWTGSCQKCKKPHNTLVHTDTFERSTEQKAGTQNSSITAHTAMNDICSQRALLATALVTILDSGNVPLKFRALLDPGADSSFISENAVQQLRLKKTKVDVEITGVGSTSSGTSRAFVKMQIGSCYDEEFSLQTIGYVLPRVTGVLPKCPVAQFDTAHVKDLVLADPKFDQPGHIDVLIGADVFFDGLRERRITGKEGQLIAQETVWGFVIGGRCSSGPFKHSVSVHHLSVDVDAALRKFWEVEEVPRKKFYTPEEQACEDHFVATHTRDERGRYVVRLPFRPDVPPLGNSVDQAIRRLMMMEKQLANKPERKKQYIEFMREYLELGHMEEIPADEIDIPDDQCFYFPHHAVMKDDSTSTKLRVVFDASAKSSSKISLNDKLMVGPKVQDDLFDQIIRFRMFLYALKADICKMYRQFLLHKKDIDFQRIVWRESPDEPIKHYRLLTETYGKSSAPHSATRCLLQLATDYELILAAAAKATKKDFYVDDLMSGQLSIQKAISLQQELIQLMELGCLSLRKWISNSKEVLEAVSEEMRETPVALDDDEQTVKTLGIIWQPNTDELRFKVSLPMQRSLVTKRTIASDVAKIFDPIGWLAPVTINGKILLQQLWKCELSWDVTVPRTIEDDWFSYKEQLSDIEIIRIPRCVHPDPEEKFKLFGFCDASIKAYAAVVYIESVINGVKSIQIVASKSKVAPVKQLSLPRLELSGAVLLVRLLDAIVNALNFKPQEIHAWTDSQIVLEWLKSHPIKWKTFVANRVAEIQEALPYECWHHVRGADNPADCASRGITAKELLQHPLWWHGPKWLADFPNMKSEEAYLSDAEKEQLEERCTVLIHHCTKKFDFAMLSLYSSLAKLIRVTAFMFRFITNIRCKNVNRKFGPLTVLELNNAQSYWIRAVQQTEFPDEYFSLCNAKEVLSKSKISCLNPFVDDADIIRVGGRLRKSNLPAAQRNPILLPKKHRLTELIILHEHLVQLHAGPQLVQACLQRKFWILGIRDAIRSITRRCVVCTRHRGDVMTQMMGDLHEARVNPAKVFMKTGIDYAGPILLREFNRRSRKPFKAYVVIFVCFATRAIHIELARSLTSSAFIAALKRFIGRRGKVSDVYTDCGRTFVGAEKELRFLREKRHLDLVTDYLSAEKIQFHFNPPSAPHFGGLWESGIKSIKYHLRRVIGNTKYNFEEMETLLIQIEACLNSRPITASSSDPQDLEPLTPGHFLIGQALTADVEPDYRKMTKLTKWQLVQKSFQEFWRRWSREYLTRLQERPKWWSPKKNIEVGNLVIIKDERFPPLKWKMGRVTELHKGEDGLVRVVQLKTEDGIIKRPIVKLCLLPIDTSSD